MRFAETFHALGFTDREVAVYLALVQLGHGPIREIAEKAGHNRGSTYDTLKALHQKGVVAYLPKGKRKLFSAEPPATLLRLAQDKQRDLERTIERLAVEVIPDLSQLQPAYDMANVHYYEGDDGVEHVLRDILSTVSGSESHTYSVYSARPLRRYLYRPFPNYTKQRVKLGIAVRVIAIGTGGEEAALSERKWIDPKKQRIASSYTAIYPPKIAMFSLAHDNYPTAVVIDAREIALSQQIVFDTLWDLL